MHTSEVKKNNRPLLLLAGCLFLAYQLPYHKVLFQAFYNEWLAALGIVIVFAYFVEEKKPSLQIPWIAIIPLGLVSVIVLQVLMGMLSESWDAILPMACLVVAALAILMGASIAARPQGASRLVMALAYAHLLAGLVSVVIASLQFVGAETPFAPFMLPMRHEPGVVIRPYANLAQPNQLALLFCLAIAAAWWLYQVGRLRGGIAAGIVLSLLWGLVLTQSRIGWIIIPVFALASVLWRGQAGFKTVSNSVVAGLVLTYAASVVALPEFAPSILGVSAISAADYLGGASVADYVGGTSVAEHVAGTVSERLVLFQQAWQMGLSHPWFGAGWYQFGPQQLAIATDFPATVYSRHAHNIVLNFAAELGWPTSILFFGLLAYWLYKSCLSRPISRELGFSILFFMAVLVHSLVEFPLWYAYILLPLALLVGMVHQEQFGSAKIALSRGYSLPVLVILASGLVAVGEDYRRVVAGFWVQEMSASGLKFNEQAMEKPAYTVFPYVYDYFQFTNTPVREGMSASEVALMERTMRRFGAAGVLTQMSQIYALNGRPDDAIKTLLTIHRLHPVKYKETYEFWRHAPEQYQAIFKRLPAPV